MHDGIMVGIGTVINDNPGLARPSEPPVSTLTFVRTAEL